MPPTNENTALAPSRGVTIHATTDVTPCTHDGVTP